MAEPTFSTVEAAAAAHVSMRMLNYYVDRGMMPGVELPGSGHHRRWTLDEVRRLRQCMTRVNAAKEILREWSSGELWRSTDATRTDT